METIKLLQHGKSMGTRELGEKLREAALSIIRSGKDLLFDFTDIDIISSAFADELFGKLFTELGEEAFKKSVKVNKFKNEEAKKIILLIINKSITFRKTNPRLSS